jgi:hypothetical protein
LFPGTFHPPIYITYPEDNGNKFLRNVGIFPSNYSGILSKEGERSVYGREKLETEANFRSLTL